MDSANYTRLLIAIILLLYLVSLRAEQNDCLEQRCSRRDPAIRFPFRLKGMQHEHCGYSQSFDLSCTKDNQTLIQLPTLAKFIVKKIDYKSQIIRLSDPDSCLPSLFRKLNLSTSPFQHTYRYTQNYTVFNCDAKANFHLYFFIISLPSCLDTSGHRLYAVSSSQFLTGVNMISCTKMYELYSVPYNIVLSKETELLLSWNTPDCSRCEAKGNRCRMKSNNTKLITECYRAQKSDATKKLVISASVIGPFGILLVAYALFYAYRKNKIDEENQVKIESFLADYEAFKPTRYSYAEIKRITDQFSEELGQGAYGTVYKGKLSNEILVAVKVLNNSKGKGEEFINEVGIIGKIHHVNVARLVGFCADGFRRALVYEFLPNGSLQNFISPTNVGRVVLSWEKMNHIALGIAKGIEYLHQGCDQRILHFDIKPHNVLLDHNFNPKISDFGTAKLCSKDQSVVSMTAARGTVGYIAPEVFSRNFGDVSYKSDVYSFGMLLLEVVGSKRKNGNVSSMEIADQPYLPEWIYKHFERGESLEIDIEEEEDVKTANKLAIVGLWCIQWQPMDRPSINVAVKMLEEKEELNVPPNPFAKGPARNNNEARMPGRNVPQELSAITELE